MSIHRKHAPTNVHSPPSGQRPRSRSSTTRPSTGGQAFGVRQPPAAFPSDRRPASLLPPTRDLAPILRCSKAAEGRRTPQGDRLLECGSLLPLSRQTANPPPPSPNPPPRSHPPPFQSGGGPPHSTGGQAFGVRQPPAAFPSDRRPASPLPPTRGLAPILRCSKAAEGRRTPQRDRLCFRLRMKTKTASRGAGRRLREASGRRG
jgi:hypothetical protein